MTYRLLVRPQAELEFLEVAEHYEDVNAGLGIAFLDELEEAKANLSKHPQFYFNTAPEKGQRRYLLNRFPYALIYEIKANEVIILAMRHTKRKPFQ